MTADIVSSTDILVLGGNGLAGSSIVAELRSKDRLVRFASRNGSDIRFDASEYGQLRKVIEELEPNIVINCIGEIDFENCDTNYHDSWKKNVNVVANLSSLSKIYGYKLVQISTDHYFVGESKERHTETSPVTLVNAYAKQKYCAEIAVSLVDTSLTVRTAFTGCSHSNSIKQPFWSWVKDALWREIPVTLFSDAFTSILDRRFFSKCLIDLIDANATGIYNLASADVFSKEEFFVEAANQLGFSTAFAASGSIAELKVARANNLGLCTKKIETLLGYRMPQLNEVVTNLIADEDQNEV